MSWDAIGAIGESVGAAAVLITLVFLIVQLRQNTQAIQAETMRETFNQGTAWMYQLIRDPELAKLYLGGLGDELENAEDRLRFHLLMQALFNQWAIAYVHRPLDSGNSGNAGGVADADVAHVLSTPGGRAYWARAKSLGLHRSEFVDYVTALEKQIEGHA
jgi:hypothetical protein